MNTKLPARCPWCKEHYYDDCAYESTRDFDCGTTIGQCDNKLLYRGRLCRRIERLQKQVARLKERYHD